MIKAGAMDSLGERNQMLSNMNKLLGFIKTHERERNTGQFSLFGTAKNNNSKLTLDPAQPVEEKIKLAWEKELLGLYVSSHPFKPIAPHFEAHTAKCKDILNNQYSPGSMVNVAGIISHIHKIFTKKNELMMFVTLEDLNGSLELIVFPRLLQKNSTIWAEDKFIFVTGRLSDKDDVPKILTDTAVEIDPEDPGQTLNKATISENNRRPLNICISIDYKNFNTQLHNSLKQIFKTHHGKNRAYLQVSQNGSSRTIATNFYIDFNEQIKSDIESLTGKNSTTAKLTNISQN